MQFSFSWLKRKLPTECTMNNLPSNLYQFYTLLLDAQFLKLKIPMCGNISKACQLWQYMHCWICDMWSYWANLLWCLLRNKKKKTYCRCSNHDERNSEGLDENGEVPSHIPYSSVFTRGLQNWFHFLLYDLQKNIEGITNYSAHT